MVFSMHLHTCNYTLFQFEQRILNIGSTHERKCGICLYLFALLRLTQ